MSPLDEDILMTGLNGDQLSDEDTLSVEDTPWVDTLGTDWVTLSAASEILGQSERTVRRKLKSGELYGELAFDPAIGTKRWMVDTSNLPVRQPAVDRSNPPAHNSETPDTAVLVPIEAIDRLEQAWGRTRDAVARAEIAERVAEFEKERRVEAEGDRDRLRSMLKAENEIAEHVAELERQRRIEAERERDRLRAMLEAEQPESRWWRRWWRHLEEM